MGYGIKDVTRKSPCPICGKDHWCAWMPTEYGKVLLCQSHSEDTSFIGNDGNTYVYVGTSRSGTGVYEEMNQHYSHIADKGEKRVCQKPQKRQITVIDEVRPLSNDVLDKVYRRMLSMLVLEDRHREYLHSEGWSDELIEKNHIVSMPIEDFKRYKRAEDYVSKNKWRKSICEQMASTFGSLRGVPGFYRKDGSWKLHCRSGIIFPMYDVQHKMYRLRVRMDFEDIIDGKDQSGRYFNDAKACYVKPLKGLYSLEEGKEVFMKSGGKYRNVSSYKEDEDALKDGYVINILADGCQANNAIGCYYSSTDDMYCCYITEGEKKGILGNSILHAPVISLPGVNSFSLLLDKTVLHTLIDLGVKVFIIAFDTDKATNEAVMKAEAKTVAALKSQGLYVGLAEWDMKHGKGLDDMLVRGYRPAFSIA